MAQLRMVAHVLGNLRPDEIDDRALRFVVTRCGPVGLRALRRVPLIRADRYLAHRGLDWAAAW